MVVKIEQSNGAIFHVGRISPFCGMPLWKTFYESFTAGSSGLRRRSST